MPGKAANTLGDAAVFQICEDLRAVSHKPTLKQFQEILKRNGVEVSERGGASTFRDQEFAAHLARLRRGSQLAAAITDGVAGGADKLDAATELATQELLDALTDVDAEGRPNLTKVSGIILNLRMAVSSGKDAKRKQVESESKLEKLEREKIEWEEKRAKIAAQIQRAQSAPAASADEIRAAAVAEIDRIMGIKTKK